MKDGDGTKEPSAEALAGPKTGAGGASGGPVGRDGLRFRVVGHSGHGFEVGLELILRHGQPTAEQKFSKLDAREALSELVVQVADDLMDVLGDQRVVDFLNSLPKWQLKRIVLPDGPEPARKWVDGGTVKGFAPFPHGQAGCLSTRCVLSQGHEGPHRAENGEEWTNLMPPGDRSVSSETGPEDEKSCWAFHPGSEIWPCVLPRGHSGDHQDARGLRWEP